MSTRPQKASAQPGQKQEIFCFPAGSGFLFNARVIAKSFAQRFFGDELAKLFS